MPTSVPGISNEEEDDYYLHLTNDHNGVLREAKT
jgi:hypothetical protein